MNVQDVSTLNKNAIMIYDKSKSIPNNILFSFLSTSVREMLFLKLRLKI